MTTTHSTKGIAALVNRYREAIAAEPDQRYDEADLIVWLLEDTAGRDWTPSQVALALKLSTGHAANLLRQLAADEMIASFDRGAWTRYFAR